MSNMSMRFFIERCWSIVLPMIFLFSGCTLHNAAPSAKDATDFLNQNRNEIDVVVDYLTEIESGIICINDDDGMIFYNYEYHKILSNDLLSCINCLWRAGCKKISKENVQGTVTISFEIWSRTMGDADCGIACTVDGQGKPITEFQISCEPIDETWFYYFDDYEEYRQSQTQYDTGEDS